MRLYPIRVNSALADARIEQGTTPSLKKSFKGWTFYGRGAYVRAMTHYEKQIVKQIPRTPLRLRSGQASARKRPASGSE